MNKTTYVRSSKLIAGVGLGALLMYVLDNRQGRRRLGLARDQMVRLVHYSRNLADAGARDLTNRATGLAAQAGRLLRRVEPSNEVLAERVRAQLGRLVSHPHAIHVAAQAGRVVLSGPVLKSEEQQLMRGVRAVGGVRAVESLLDVHDTGDHLPALQGGNERLSAPQPEFLQKNWAPGPRLLALAAGTALAGLGLARRGVPGSLLGLAGIGLAARAATNTEIGRLLGITGGRRGVELQKAITIAAPREKVFELWSDFENFPRFMSHVETVHCVDETTSHWVVKGPAGARFEWDSVITDFVRPEVIAWRSEPGAMVRHAGIVRFDEVEDGTRVSVSMCYNLPGGIFTRSLAALAGRDPKQELDADLMRMKSFIETGTPPHDSAERVAARHGGVERAVGAAPPMPL